MNERRCRNRKDDGGDLEIKSAAEGMLYTIWLDALAGAALGEEHPFGPEGARAAWEKRARRWRVDQIAGGRSFLAEWKEYREREYG